MSNYKFLGLTKFAELNLSDEDIETLNKMIGSTVYKSDECSYFDGKSMFIMPDGEETHVDFLILEELQSELPFIRLK